NMTSPKLDGVVLFCALAVSLATAFLFGLAPALRASRTDVVSGLKEGGATGQCLKRRCVDPALDQAEEVYRNAHKFCKLFLREPPLLPDRQQALSELFAKAHGDCRQPPICRNLITGTTESDYGSRVSSLPSQEHEKPMRRRLGGPQIAWVRLGARAWCPGFRLGKVNSAWLT